ncbi:MAG TPA: hypothetical protein PLN62_10795, partial [Microbacterium sp.]|nr:hypothetical protein [Microbacterium sp.]
ERRDDPPRRRDPHGAEVSGSTGLAGGLAAAYGIQSARRGAGPASAESRGLAALSTPSGLNTERPTKGTRP